MENVLFEESRTPIQAWEEILTDVMENVMPGVIAKIPLVFIHEIVDTAVQITDGLHKAWAERQQKFEAGK